MTSTLSMLSLPGMLGLLPVLAFLAKATALLLLSLAGAVALRRASAGARHILWCGALAGVVLLPLLSRWAPWRLEVLPSQATWLSATRASATRLPANDSRERARPADEMSAAAPPGQIGTPASPGLDQQAARPSPQALSQSLAPQLAQQVSSSSAHVPPHDPGLAGSTSGTANLINVWFVLLALWAVGVLILLARLVAGAIAVRRIVHGARAPDAPGWTAPLWEVADRLDLARAPRLLVSTRVSMPFACGLVRPAVVLPSEAYAWSDERRRAVLLHELAHIRRHDLLGHTLGRITCALYWFHPLVWTAARRLRAESERACDDLVLTVGTRASEYAEHLLQILTAARSGPAPTAALAMARRKEFEGRMLAILDPGLRRAAPGRLQSSALVLGLVGLAVSVSAMAPATSPASGQATHVVHAPDASTSTTFMQVTRAAADSAAPRGATPAQPLPEVVPSPTRRAAARADTGENRPGSIGEMVNSIVSAVVSPVVDATVDQAVQGSISELANGWYVDADAIARHSVDATRHALRRSLQMKVGQITSPGRTTHVDSASTALLVQLLRSDSAASVRKTAAWALAQRVDHGAARWCTSWSRNDCTDRRGTRRSDSAVAVALAAALEHDPSTDVREMAAWGLSRSESPAAVQALGDAVQRDADAHVKATAAWALGQIGDSSVAPALDGALADPSATVRSRAAWALGQIAPTAAPPGLARMLKDPDMHVRLMAAWALGQIADPKTLPALSAALSAEQDHKVRQAELRAVLMLGQDSDDALRELLKSPDPEIRVRATRALAGYGTGAWPMPMPMPMPRPMP